jgi:hypothetical protein
MLYQKEFLSVLFSLYKHHTLYISIITRAQRAEYTFSQLLVIKPEFSSLGEKGGRKK